jgi:predicted GNAT family acetyltransferase
MHIGDKVAFIDYILAKGNIYLTHTEVPEELEGKGYAKSLVAEVLHEIDKRDLVLVPLCPFVALYIKRNPEWRRLVYRGTDLI